MNFYQPRRIDHCNMAARRVVGRRCIAVMRRMMRFEVGLLWMPWCCYWCEEAPDPMIRSNATVMNVNEIFLAASRQIQT